MNNARIQEVLFKVDILKLVRELSHLKNIHLLIAMKIAKVRVFQEEETSLLLADKDVVLVLMENVLLILLKLSAKTIMEYGKVIKIVILEIFLNVDSDAVF